jgi:hypothetical protein
MLSMFKLIVKWHQSSVFVDFIGLLMLLPLHVMQTMDHNQIVGPTHVGRVPFAMDKEIPTTL